jgi:hypothetical protein
MQRARLFEIIGAFALGGGVVAVGYELARGPDGSIASAHPEGDGTSAETPKGRGEVDRAVSGDRRAASEGASAEQDASSADSDDGDAPPHLVPDDSGSYGAFPPLFDDGPAFDDEAEATYPRHGLVTSVAAIVRERADLESPIIGILRGGTRVRVDGERTFGGGCREGWNRVFPRGWICHAAGLSVGDTPPDDGIVTVPQPDLDSALPYEYWRVNDEMTPFFHRLPSFEEQDRADRAGQAWYAAKGREPMPTHPAERPSEVPAVVKEYMNAGYYVTKAGEEIKSQRRFLRTLRGAYARKYQLGQKEGSDFRGRLLANEDDLPLYFITRELTLRKREAEGSDVLVDSDIVPKRLETHPFVRKVNIGPKAYYEDADGLLIRTYAVGRAYKLKRPPGVGADERWVHVDLSEQTLVAYDGDIPVFVTLVSTGKEPGMTPIGVHRVQIKHVATPMRDQPVEDEAYSIDDVPWTQYFHGSIALHGAFWHGGFGLVRSHGCVNLSPPDARWLFGFTDPPLPNGWHAAAPTRGTVKGSAVVVTE